LISLHKHDFTKGNLSKILGRKHIYLPHAQTAIYDSKVKLFLKRGISHQLGRDAVVRFECENSAIYELTSFQNKKNDRLQIMLKHNLV
jgi:hypothetical protein